MSAFAASIPEGIRNEIVKKFSKQLEYRKQWATLAQCIRFSLLLRTFRTQNWQMCNCSGTNHGRRCGTGKGKIWIQIQKHNCVLLISRLSSLSSRYTFQVAIWEPFLELKHQYVEHLCVCLFCHFLCMTHSGFKMQPNEKVGHFNKKKSKKELCRTCIG